MWGKHIKPNFYNRDDGTKVIDERKNKPVAQNNFRTQLLTAGFSLLLGVSGFFIVRWIDSVEKKAEANETEVKEVKTDINSYRIIINEKITKLQADSENQNFMLKKIDTSVESLRTELVNNRYRNS